ncbi:MAG: RNA polymerase sigma-70 factor [Muribaculaceae bacterium]|nr:RNA polymerase sigma-70 factor [Muribaculaceae bacterium]
MASIDESILILELREGSVKAFNALYKLYFPQLYNFSLLYTKSGCDAEEIVHDVFVRLWNIRHQIKATSTLRPLLFIMAKHYLINAIRSNVGSPVYEDYLEYTDRLAENASARMEYDEFRRRVSKAMLQLPQQQRKAIIMSRFHGMTTSQIASSLNISEQTVYNNIHLGLKRLRTLLGEMALLVLSASNEIVNQL